MTAEGGQKQRRADKRVMKTRRVTAGGRPAWAIAWWHWCRRSSHKGPKARSRYGVNIRSDVQLEMSGGALLHCRRCTLTCYRSLRQLDWIRDEVLLTTQMLQVLQVPTCG